jgi:hypothetical protein
VVVVERRSFAFSNRLTPPRVSAIDWTESAGKVSWGQYLGKIVGSGDVSEFLYMS